MEYKLYAVKKGDTLESIALDLGISVAELRRFHNSYCELSHLIGDKIPSQCSSLCIPSQSIFNQNLPVKLQITNGTYKYHLEQYYQLILASKSITESTQKREWEVTYKKELFHYEVEIKTLYSDKANKNARWDSLSDFIQTINKPLDFLQLKLSLTGSLLEVLNTQEINQKWHEIKVNFLRKPNFEKVIKQGDQQYAKLLDKLKQDSLIFLFFPSFYEQEKAYKQPQITEKAKKINSILFSGLENQVNILQNFYKKNAEQVYFKEQWTGLQTSSAQMKDLYEENYKKLLALDYSHTHYYMDCQTDYVLSAEKGNIQSYESFLTEKIHEKSYYILKNHLKEIL